MWVFELEDGVDPQDFAAAHGLVLVGGVAGLPRMYEFADAHGRTRSFAERSSSSSSAGGNAEKARGWRWAEEQVPRTHALRHTAPPQARTEATRDTAEEPNDPLYAKQWHFERIGVKQVWETGNHGEGVTVAVVDDGLHHAHEDLAPNYCRECSYDFNNNRPDPTPTVSFEHGTRVGGVVAARDNSVCGVGVAYRARVAGIRLVSASTTDATEARALTYEAQRNDIYSCSWGPTDDGRRLEGMGPLLRAAVAKSVAEGRGGLGSVYVWASGNGRTSGDSCNYDGYANSRFVVSVGAVGQDGRVASYSEGCSALMTVTPSSSSGQAGLPTINYWSGSNTACYESFGGTSAAAPEAAGVVALMLAANPQLTWRDVQHIVVAASEPVDTQSAGWALVAPRHAVTQRPLYHSNDYGFGLLNASTAVALARNWTRVAPLASWSSGTVLVNQPVPDDPNSAGVASTVFVSRDVSIEWVEVVLTSKGQRRGDMEITLTSPSGTTSVLASAHSDSNADINTWTFTSCRHWSQSSAGKWTLRMADKKKGKQGTFSSWVLRIHGTEHAASDTQKNS